MLKPISQYIFLNRKVYSDSIGTLCHWWWRVLILSSSISLAKHSKEIQVQYTLGLWPGAHSCFSRKWLTWSVNQSEHHDDLLTHRRNDFHITVGRGGISLLKVISIIFCFRANFGLNKCCFFTLALPFVPCLSRGAKAYGGSVRQESACSVKSPIVCLTP